MAQHKRVRRRARARKGVPVLRRAPSRAAAGAQAEVKKRLPAGEAVTVGAAKDPAEKAAEQVAKAAVRARPEPGKAGAAEVPHPAVKPRPAKPDSPPARAGEHAAAARAAARADAPRQAEDQAALTRPVARRMPAAPAACGSGGAAPSGAGGAPARANRVAEAALGAGQPLPARERRFFEPRLGADLSAVRLHAGAEGAEAANRMEARAFALGDHLAFAPGEAQNLSTPAGRDLLAHELAHVVSETGEARRRRKPDRPGGRKG
ncbi:DUF4157 domain-containing protein [Roseomonas sp. M0104]|uniref:DUF4157 domain-containing protein n=1 Tax=Teichococcus coralli TaxID=2545983 RepID=A0A845BEW6_9PROT|nr:DUF4157 domain-containing protein [Pseudoroseomonas coralli]MXP65368.1 DUF4157 domain-containing protein [Pseudoroseomonas coralli]